MGEFIKVTNGKLTKALKDLDENAEVFIHYNCENCDDEQVTNIMDTCEVADVIETLEKSKFIFSYLECTNCGTVNKFIRSSYVQGIEIVE